MFIGFLLPCLIFDGYVEAEPEPASEPAVTQPEQPYEPENPAPEPEPESETESPAQPAAVAYSYYPIFERVKRISTGCLFSAPITFTLSDQERATFWQLMRVDAWVVAEDLPGMGEPPPQFSFAEYDNGEWIQTWFFSQWEEGQALIIPSMPPLRKDIRNVSGTARECDVQQLSSSQRNACTHLKMAANQ